MWEDYGPIQTGFLPEKIPKGSQEEQARYA